VTAGLKPRPSKNELRWYPPWKPTEPHDCDHANRVRHDPHQGDLPALYHGHVRHSCRGWHLLFCAGGRIHCAAGKFGLGKILAAEPDCGPGPADLRRRAGGRPQPGRIVERRAGALPPAQRGNCFSSFQPGAEHDRGGKRRTAAAPGRDGAPRAGQPRPRSSRSRGIEPAARAPAGGAFRRRAAARGVGAGVGEFSSHPPGRRAHGKPRQPHRNGNHGAHWRLQPALGDDRPAGHARTRPGRAPRRAIAVPRRRQAGGGPANSATPQRKRGGQ